MNRLGAAMGSPARQVGMLTEILRKAAHFRNLPDEALERLAQGFEEVEIEDGAKVYAAGEPVEALFVVARGTIVVFRGQRGEESRPVARLCSGDLFGTADLFDSELHSETACALEESVVLRGSRAALWKFLEDQPQVALNLRLAAARDLTARAKIALAVAHRQAVRHRVNRNVRVKPMDDGAVRLTLVDLSPGGMSLRGAPESWQPDVVADYRLEWGTRHLDLTGRVAWREGDRLGIDLVKPSAELQAEIERMLEKMLASQI